VKINWTEVEKEQIQEKRVGQAGAQVLEKNHGQGAFGRVVL